MKTRDEILKGNYSVFVKWVEETLITPYNRFGRIDRCNVIAFCIGYFGYVNEILFDMISRLYVDGFID